MSTSQASKIFLLYDYSPTWANLYATLIASSEQLQRANIEIAPFDEWCVESSPTHGSIWDNRQEPKLLAWGVITQLEKIKGLAAAEKNVLLWSRSMAGNEHQFFWNALSDYVNVDELDIRCLFILGSPALIAENLYRQPYNRANFSPQTISTLIPCVSYLLNWYGQKLQPDATNVIANKALNPFEPVSEEILAHVSHFLGCPPLTPEPVRMQPLAYRSHFIRRIDAAMEVRYNTWPALDKEDIYRQLKLADEGLEEDFLAPLALKEQYRALEGQWENFCKVEPGYFALPDSYWQTQTDSTTPLPPDLLHQIISGLSPANQSALYQRLKQDVCLLSSDQQSLLASFESPDAAEFQKLELPEARPLVTVLTMTFNQEKYIGQCMDSVLMQQTPFPIEHIVLDHHSTDATPRIVAEYAEKYPTIRPVLLSQRFPAENERGLCLRCRSKYAIFCDGDDYFTDPAKLKIQVEYLEQHPEISFCFHPVAAVFEDGSPSRIFPRLDKIPKTENGLFNLGDLVKGNFVQTNSVMYRWRFTDGLPSWFHPEICMTDWYVHMLHAETGAFGFIPRIMAAYRRHSGALFASAHKAGKYDFVKRMGIAQLVAYNVCILHFDEQYHPEFIKLGRYITNDFKAIAEEEGDTRLWDLAVKKFGRFLPEQ